MLYFVKFFFQILSNQISTLDQRPDFKLNFLLLLFFFLPFNLLNSTLSFIYIFSINWLSSPLFSFSLSLSFEESIKIQAGLRKNHINLNDLKLSMEPPNMFFHKIFFLSSINLSNLACWERQKNLDEKLFERNLIEGWFIIEKGTKVVINSQLQGI